MKQSESLECTLVTQILKVTATKRVTSSLHKVDVEFEKSCLFKLFLGGGRSGGEKDKVFTGQCLHVFISCAILGQQICLRVKGKGSRGLVYLWKGTANWPWSLLADRQGVTINGDIHVWKFIVTLTKDRSKVCASTDVCVQGDHAWLGQQQIICAMQCKHGS